jgi:predicted nucleic acid-binding Zn finger protein
MYPVQCVHMRACELTKFTKKYKKINIYFFDPTLSVYKISNSIFSNEGAVKR